MVTFNGTEDDSGNDVVISGMSGLFPMSANVKEYEYNLYNKVHMVNDDESRWEHTNPDVPRFSGKIPRVKYFDAPFFGVHQTQADNMDPQNRMLLEEAFKAVADAGVNPLSLRGSNTGVYIGTWSSESELHLFYDHKVPSGFGITGTSQAMFANRISYVLGLNGPSFLCNTVGSSSMYALDLAFSAFQKGDIDAAIVGCSNLCLHPNLAKSIADMGFISRIGRSRPFDKDADGYVRSEAISCIFLQRRSAAKRVYATVIMSGKNFDGYRHDGIFYPSSSMQEQLLKELYAKVDVDINDLGYFEANCSGAILADTLECKAIDNAICKQRKEPLLIGSVKSNCGNTESAAGMTAVVKVLLAMQNNTIPPNINFEQIREDIEGLKEKRLRVVTEPTRLPKPYVGINCIGYGTNAHILLKQHDKTKDLSSQNNELLRLVTWSSRTEANANAFFMDLQSKPLDAEYLALVQGAQEGGIQGMMFRGYTIMKSEPNVRPIVLDTKIEHNAGIRRPITFVFSGMGSQWSGMGKSLLALPLFNQSIKRSHDVLKPFGMNLTDIITSDDPTMFDNVLHSFVGIAAIQVALIDILFELNIKPDYIIGHSVGELGCAYADQCVTAEQVILAAYYRGKVSRDLATIRGSMAAIGMGYEDIKSIVPETIEVACHNSADSCTISGPCEEVAKFVKELKAKNVFAKEVPCSNIAYHSKYISHFGPELLKHLKQMMPKPKRRSAKWISTSVPVEHWSKPESQYCSAEYYTNNLLKSVLFEEAAKHIPQDSLTIEIAPHALLQSILRNAFSEGVHIGLTKRHDPDNLQYLLNSLGTLYIAGLEPRIEKLYPPVKFPVARGTQSLSPLIDFDRSKEYYVVKYSSTTHGSGVQNFNVKLSDRCKFLKGHQIDGRIIIPATFYLECVWRTLAAAKAITQFDTLAVEFENVKFVRATTLTPNDSVQLNVVIQTGSGFFEVTESKSLIVSGYVRQLLGKTKPQTVPKATSAKEGTVELQSVDFYKELKLRGYHYNGEFQAVDSVSSDGLHGKVKWAQNWVTFMDCLLQLSIFGFDSRNIKLPTRIRQLRVYPQCHESLLSNNEMAEVFINEKRDLIIAGGVEISGLDFITVQRRKMRNALVLEKYQFVPYWRALKLGIEDVAKCCIQLVLENDPKTTLHIVECSTDRENSETLLPALMKAIGDLPLINGTYRLCHKSRDAPTADIPNIEHINADDDLSQVYADIAVVNGNDAGGVSSTIIENIDANGFVIFREKSSLSLNEYKPLKDFVAIACFTTELETFVLARKDEHTPKTADIAICKVSMSDDKFQWIKKLQDMAEKSKEVIVVSQGEPLSGIIGLVNCLRREPNTSAVKCVFIEDANAPPFDIKLPLYEKQLKLNLAINVYRKGVWGSYRHLSLLQEPSLISCADHVYGNIKQLGDFSSLQWFNGPFDSQKASIRVVYSSLNFRDVMLASGRLPVDILGGSRLDQTCVFGFEYSGIDVKSNKPVMGMVVKAAVSSHLSEFAPLTWEVPKNWSLREAATVPVVYITVYYAFFFTADIRKGKSILIHAGSGGIGIAAIRVALAYGLEVFTTVSTQEKKQFLLQTFPALNEKNIGNSRDTSFEEMVMQRTKGKGVSFVLNSLSEDKLLASVRCLSQGGRFLEIGKFDMANDNDLGLGVFLNELSFHAILADKLFTVDKKLVESLKERISEDIERGIIKPLPTTVFKAQDIERAFRYLMSGKHMGKVLLQIRNEPESKTTLPIHVSPQVYFSPDLVYVLVDGLSGFGLELTDWMVLRGARKIVFSSRHGITNSYQRFRISLWQSYGCFIAVNTSDITTESGCTRFITDAKKLGAIGSIYNVALPANDAFFCNQNAELFKSSFELSALVTKQLDIVSRKLCPQLQHFVVFSSISCGRGVAGQSNHGLSHSVTERIIEERVLHGFTGKVIQWGPVGEIDTVVEKAPVKIDVDVGGAIQQRINSCLEVLDVLLSSPEPIVSSTVVADKIVVNVRQSPLDAVVNIMSIRDIKSVPASSTLADVGMDSLTAIEIKQVLERDFDISISPAELSSLTFEKLAEYSKNCASAPAEVKTTTQGEIRNAVKLLYSYVPHALGSTAGLECLKTVAGTVPLVIFTGIEGGCSKIWRDLAVALNRSAYVLQLKENFTLNEITQYAFKQITKLLQEHDSKLFKIVAYSFGSVPAHTVSVLLEQNGYVGKVVLIGGCLSEMEHIHSAIKEFYKEDELPKFLLSALANKFVPNVSIDQLFSVLCQQNSKAHIEQCVSDILKANGIKDVKKVFAYIEAVLQKSEIIENLDEFRSTALIQAPVLLLKPTIPLIKSFDDFEGLSTTAKNIKIIDDMEGNHETILQHKNLANIINDYFKE